MTNQQIIDALWEAYKAGNRSQYTSESTPLYDKMYRSEFDHWVKEHYPQLFEVHKPRKTYYHSFGCRANHFTPHGMNDCTCNGEGDPTKNRGWDNPVVKNAIVQAALDMGEKILNEKK